MADVQIIQSDNGNYNLIVDGEWYAEGDYEYVSSMRFDEYDDEEIYDD